MARMTLANGEAVELAVMTRAERLAQAHAELIDYLQAAFGGQLDTRPGTAAHMLASSYASVVDETHDRIGHKLGYDPRFSW